MTSGARSRRLKKRSASSSTSSKPPEAPLVVFVDECLGSNKVPTALAAAGVDVKTLSDIGFGKGTKDEDWLAELAGRGWLVFTKDKNIRRRPLEAGALISAGLGVF